MDSTPTRVVTGVTDTRTTPLDRLASTDTDAASEGARRVLPGEDDGRVAVAQFSSSI